jgi:hypothetical protein
MLRNIESPSEAPTKCYCCISDNTVRPQGGAFLVKIGYVNASFRLASAELDEV